MKHDIYSKFLILMFIVGIGLILYPTIGDIYSSFNQSVHITDYVTAVAKMDDETYNKILQDAHDFNDEVIYPKGGYGTLTAEEKERYMQQLNFSVNGMMGYIDIPTIKTSLAIYHTTEEQFLQIGAGHLEATSLPVGGENTHCAISGHRGLVSAKLFTNLNQLVKGDIFTLHILDETLTYQVDQVFIVLPYQTESLHIEDGADYCTLITCTPYGVNTHRLLVRGHRIDNLEDVAKRIPSDAMQVEPVLIAIVMAVPVLLILLLWMAAQKFA